MSQIPSATGDSINSVHAVNPRLEVMTPVFVSLNDSVTERTPSLCSRSNFGPSIITLLFTSHMDFLQ